MSNWTRISSVIALVLALSGCSRDPQKARQQYLESAQKYARKGQHAAAIVQYQNALQYDRQSADTLHHLAESYLANRQPREAYAALMQAVAVDPNRTDVRLNLGRLYLGAGDLKKAEEQAALVVQRDPKNAEAYQVLGASLAGQRQAQKSVQAFEKAAELAPRNASSYVNLGASLTALGNTAEAERNFRKALELDPAHLAAHLALAELYRRGGQTQKAEQALRTAIEKNPAELAPYLLLAGLLAAQGKTAELETHLATLRERIPKPETALALGDFFAARNQRDRAVAEYTRGAETAPKNLDLKVRLVEHQLAAGNLKEAERWNAEILRDRPKDVRAGIARGRILLAQGKRSEAIDDLRQLVSQAKDSAEAHHVLGLAYIRNLQPSQAKVEFQEAVRLDSRFLPARLSLAELQMNLGELGSAREAAEAAVKMYPNSPPARSLLGTALLRQREFVAAREQLSAARALAPRDPAIPTMIGVSYAAERKWPEAERELEAALKLDPKYAPALNELGAVLTAGGQAGKALARLEQQAAARPDDAEAQLAFGSLCRQQRDSRAEAALARAVQFAPQNIRARLQLGGLYQDQKRLDAAIQQYEEALKLEPRSASLHALLGSARLQKGERESARKHFEQAYAIDPNSGVLANNLAVTTAETGGNLDAALALAQKARELAPDLVNAADTLGWIQYKKGLYQAAVPLLEECVKKAPDSPTYRYHLGMALVASGQGAKGRPHLESALKLKLPEQDALEAKATLAKLR